MIAPWTKGLGNEPKTSSKRDADSPRNHLEIFFAWCVPFLVALFVLLRRGARRRLGWAVPALLGVFLGGCGGCSSNDNGASSPNAGTTYLYDAAHRVTAAQGQGAASYAYDSASNLTSITTSAASSAGGTAPQSYSYTSTNAITSGTYDANGSPTSLGGATYTWDSANRLASATVGSTTSTFTYDGLSRLVRIVDKKDGSVVADRAFTWCGAERCAAHDNLQSGSPVVTRYFREGVVNAGQSLYELRDRLGSVRQLVDGSGKVRAQYDYDPYGNRTKVSGDLDSEIGYAGYYHHPASGLDLTLYRAYDPSHGRWLNRDPSGEAGGMNLYSYVEDNPLDLTDRLGLFVVYYGASASGFFGVGFNATLGNFYDSSSDETGGYASWGTGFGISLGFGIVVGFAGSQKDLQGSSASLGGNLGPIGAEIGSSTTPAVQNSENSVLDNPNDLVCRGPGDDDIQEGNEYRPSGGSTSVGVGFPLGGYASSGSSIVVPFHSRHPD